MNFKRFNQIWTALVTNRFISPTIDHDKKIFPNNNASKQTVDALVSASDGDFKYFDKINVELTKHDIKTYK